MQVDRSDLLKALKLTGKGAGGKTSVMPALRHVLLTPGDGHLRLTTTNLERGVHTSVAAEVDGGPCGILPPQGPQSDQRPIPHGEGSLAAPLHLLLDYVAALPDGPITLTADTQRHKLRVAAGKNSSRLAGLAASEFPTLPLWNGDASDLEVPADELCDALRQVSCAAARDDSRPTLKGVCLRVAGGEMVLAATDGYRLSVRKVALDTAASWGVIIPIDSVGAVTAVLSAAVAAGDDEEVTVALAMTAQENQVIFHTPPSGDVLSQRIAGNFPDYEMIIPKTHTTRFVVDREALARSIKLAGLFSDRVTISVQREGEDGAAEVKVTAASPFEGDTANTLPAILVGEPIEFDLNTSYAAATLSVFPVGEVAIELTQPTKPIVFKPVDLDGLVHVIMPMADKEP